MLTQLNQQQKRTVLEIAEAVAPCDSEVFDELLAGMRPKPLAQGDMLFRMGDPGGTEFFVTEGLLRTYVLSPEGDVVTMNFLSPPAR